jgi:hypothetical protein
MTKTRILAATAVLSLIASTHVFANPRDAMPAPGTYSQYYPDADVLQGGASTPYAQLHNHNWNGVMNSASDTSCAERYRSYDPKSGTFIGHDGRRHPCR